MSLQTILETLKAKGCQIAPSYIPGHLMIDGRHLTIEEVRKL